MRAAFHKVLCLEESRKIFLDNDYVFDGCERVSSVCINIKIFFKKKGGGWLFFRFSCIVLLIRRHICVCVYTTTNAADVFFV